jgi:hypothetical protein
VRLAPRSLGLEAQRDLLLAGGHCHGHLCAFVLWNCSHGPLSWSLYHALVAYLHLPGLWLGLGHRPAHDYDSFVARWDHRCQALYTLLCVPRLPALPPTLAPLGAVIRLAAQFVPAGAVIRVSFDDTTKKKAGTPIEGLARYRNGAGSARQEYRTLWGLHFVVGIMRLPLKHGYIMTPYTQTTLFEE